MLLPTTAQQILRIECVRIKDIGNWHRWTTLPGAAIGAWEGADAAAIIDLVVGLPGSGLKRCFVPGYGIRAHGTEGILFEIAFCFRCHNALVLQPDQHGELVGFDPDSPPARELLGKFQANEEPSTAQR